MSSIITILAEFAGLVPKEERERTSGPRSETDTFPPSGNENTSQREFSSRDNKHSEKKYGQFKPLVDALRFALEGFAIGELQGHRAINPSMRCRVNLIEIKPLSEEAAVPLRTLLSIHKPTAIGDFIDREILKNLTNGRHFDFSEFGGLAPIGLNATDDMEFAEDPLLAEFGRSNTRTVNYDITIVWDPHDGQDCREPSTDDVEHDEWLLHVGGEASSRKLPRQSAKAPLTIGKSEECDIVVNETFVSSLHGKLWFDKAQWWYVDNSSTNGSCIRRPKHTEVICPRKAEADQARPSPVALPPGSRIYVSAIVEDDTPYLQLAPSSTEGSGQSRSVGTPVKQPPTA